MTVSWYVDRAGRSLPIRDFAHLVMLVRSGEITPETMLFDGQRQMWVPAGQTNEFRQATMTPLIAPVAAPSSKAPWVTAVLVVFIVFALAVTAVSWGIMRYRSNRAELQSAADQALRATDRLAAQIGDKPGRKTEASTIPGINAINAPDMTIAMRFIAAQAQKSREVTAELQREAEAIPLSNVMKPATLTSAAGIRESRDLVAAYGRYLAHYESAIRTDRSRIESEAGQLDLSPAFRRGFVEGIRKGQVESGRLNEEFLSVEHRLVSTLNEVLDFMSERAGRVTVSGGHLRFRSGDDVTAYNDLVHRIQSLAEEEQDVNRRLLAMRQDGRSRIEQVAREAAK